MPDLVLLRRIARFAAPLPLAALVACGATSAASPLATTSVPPTTVVTAVPAPTADPALADISGLSDEFEDAGSLSQWSDHATVEGWPNWIEQVDIDTTAPGQMYLVPVSSGWFEDERGVFLFKEVTGDFDVTTRIRTTGKTGDLPSLIYSLAGLMVRAPRDITMETWTPGGENWAFITTGYGDRFPRELEGKPQIETKTTRDSRSDLRLILSRNDWVDLRIVRVGPKLIMLYRFMGEEWRISRRFDRADLPATLQVGLNAYSPNGPTVPAEEGNRMATRPPGDLIVRVEYMRYRRPTIDAAYSAKIREDTMKGSDWLAAVGDF